MRSILFIIASVSIVASFGCSTANPWEAPGSQKPAPVAASSSAPAPVTTTEASSSATKADPIPEDAVAPDQLQIKKYPYIRAELATKAEAELQATMAVETLPLPEEGKARITRYNKSVSIIEFISPVKYNKNDRVYLTKGTKSTLVRIVSLEGEDKMISEEVRGVKDAPELEPGDEVVCGIWIDPEDEKAVLAARKKSEDATKAADEEDAEEDLF